MTATTPDQFTGSPATKSGGRIVRRLVGTAAISLLLVACGDDGESSSSTTVPTTDAPATTVAATCADAEALTASIAALADVDVAAEGTDGVTAAVATVKSDLETFAASASDELQPQVEAVQTSVESLEMAIDDFDAEGAGPVLTAVSAVTSSAATLIESVDAGVCGS